VANKYDPKMITGHQILCDTVLRILRDHPSDDDGAVATIAGVEPPPVSPNKLPGLMIGTIFDHVRSGQDVSVTEIQNALASLRDAGLISQDRDRYLLTKAGMEQAKTLKL